MLGLLPTSLTIHEKDYEIRSDYRNILTIISAFNDDVATICITISADAYKNVQSNRKIWVQSA